MEPESVPGAPWPGTRRAEVATLVGTPRGVELRLLVDGRVLDVDVPLEPATARALPHVYALHGHAPGCPCCPDVHIELLLRAVSRIGGQADSIVVRGGEHPAFWLRLAGPRGMAEVELGVLDAVSLLASRRLPVQVEDGGDRDWDDALRALTDE